jgi:phosphonate transport system substrate-binding protein
MSIRPLAGLAAVVLIALLGAGLPRAEAQASPPGGLAAKKVVIALKPDKNPEQMLTERRALEAYLSSQVNRPVEVIIPLSSAVIIEGFANGTIDLGYLSATDMVNAETRGSASLLLAGEINGQPHYKSYWVALAEKPYASVEDLRGQPVIFASRTSTSGFLIPMWDLRQKGLISEKAVPEEFFGRGNVAFGTGYVSAIEQVLRGQAEAAAVSYYVLDEDKHLSPEQRARLKKVAEQGPVPTHVIAVRASLSPADQATLREALLRLNQSDNEDLRDKVFTSKLITVDGARHLAPIREALQLIGRGR